MGSGYPDIQLVCFSLGEDLFGVDIMRVSEIVLPKKLSALPGDSQMLEGVINLRGALIPGHSESLMNVTTRFTLRHFKNDMIYQKPEHTAGVQP